MCIKLQGLDEVVAYDNDPISVRNREMLYLSHASFPLRCAR